MSERMKHEIKGRTASLTVLVSEGLYISGLYLLRQVTSSCRYGCILPFAASLFAQAVGTKPSSSDTTG